MADREYRETDYAWAAGFLDGEGCFTLAKAGKNCHPATRRPTVAVGQIRIEPLQKLSDMFGDRVRPLRVNARGIQIHQWSLGSAESIKAMIPLILPYLINKKDEAEVIYAYAVWMGSRGRNYTEIEIKARMDLIAEFERLRLVA